MLARLTWGLWQYSQDDAFLKETYSGLLRLFERWMTCDTDKDGFPEWQSEAAKLALYDETYHPVLSGRDDTPLSFHYENLLRAGYTNVLYKNASIAVPFVAVISKRVSRMVVAAVIALSPFPSPVNQRGSHAGGQHPHQFIRVGVIGSLPIQREVVAHSLWPKVQERL